MSQAEPTFEVRQDRDEVSRSPVVRVVAIALVVATLSMVAVVVLSRKGPATSPKEPEISTSNLESSLIFDTERGLSLRKSQGASLDGYAVADPDAGIARVPVDVAIDLLLAHPLSATEAIEPKDTSHGPALPRPKEPTP